MFTNAPAHWSWQSCSRSPLVLTLLLGGATTLTVPSTATAGTYRCTNAAGEVSYSEVNCPADFAKQELDIPARNPDSAPAADAADPYSILNQARSIDEQQAAKAKARAEAREREAQAQARDAEQRARDAELRARDAEARAAQAQRDAQMQVWSGQPGQPGHHEWHERAHERDAEAQDATPIKPGRCPDGSVAPGGRLSVCRGAGLMRPLPAVPEGAHH
ncbi:DUF4124 domain-containing protein [uncultured Thiodictyon sp.]|uniref:DUF4124 domain-containing protein n=1 Tax=uncultured Thiodictyon sp. TaxID=1846217 RepID=UPI0025FCDA7D|nr:DUF4124 domain-containing protein [uncultured Thiodictyon sp.]